jgi:hypothetical protein
MLTRRSPRPTLLFRLGLRLIKSYDRELALTDSRACVRAEAAAAVYWDQCRAAPGIENGTI